MKIIQQKIDIRDYIHVVDLVRAHIAALPALDKNNSGIYNLGNGNGFSILEMLNAAKKVTNVDIKSEVVVKKGKGIQHQ